MGSMVNNIVITMYGARWVLEISEGPHCKVQYVIGHYAVHLKLIQNSVECKL